jgi:ketosteroid isomerase-like protein
MTMVQWNSDDPHGFQQFMRLRADAASAYVNGDAGPVLRLLTREASTFYGPGGGWVEGADEVAETQERGAKSFQPGGDNALELLQVFASGEVGCWVGIQLAHVRTKGKAEPVAMSLRVTEVFRHEAGAWRLVHRHADMLTEKAEPR